MGQRSRNPSTAAALAAWRLAEIWLGTVTRQRQEAEAALRRARSYEEAAMVAVTEARRTFDQTRRQAGPRTEAFAATDGSFGLHASSLAVDASWERSGVAGTARKARHVRQGPA